jgi:hypothetical protein
MPIKSKKYRSKKVTMPDLGVHTAAPFRNQPGKLNGLPLAENVYGNNQREDSWTFARLMSRSAIKSITYHDLNRSKIQFIDLEVLTHEMLPKIPIFTDCYSPIEAESEYLSHLAKGPTLLHVIRLTIEFSLDGKVHLSANQSNTPKGKRSFNSEGLLSPAGKNDVNNT